MNEEIIHEVIILSASRTTPLTRFSSFADRGRSVLHFRDLLRRLGASLWKGKLRSLGPWRFQQSVDSKETDLWTPSGNQKSVIVQGLGWPHARLHHRGRGVQLGRWGLWQTGSWEQLHTEIPQDYSGATARKGRLDQRLVICYLITDVLFSSCGTST